MYLVGEDRGMSDKEELERLLREAEKLSYQIFCNCDLGEERQKAYSIYENIRNVKRIRIEG